MTQSVTSLSSDFIPKATRDPRAVRRRSDHQRRRWSALARGRETGQILRQFAACFTDYRNPDLIEHQVEEMVAQRVYGLALGYEDLNDHEELRNDPLLAVLVEKSDPSQEALAGKSTLNRLELTPETPVGKSVTKRSCWITEPWTACWWISSFKPSGETERNHFGPGCYRRSVARAPGRAFLPWLLRALLLPTVVHLLRRVPVVCAVATVEHRCLSRKCRGAEAHRGTDSCCVAPGAPGVREIRDFAARS